MNRRFLDDALLDATVIVVVAENPATCIAEKSVGLPAIDPTLFCVLNAKLLCHAKYLTSYFAPERPSNRDPELGDDTRSSVSFDRIYTFA